MKTKIIASILISQILFCQIIVAQTRGVGVRVKNQQTGTTEEIKLYTGSYALVIGESNYTNGWDPLAGVKSDVAEVKRVLERGGFTVEAEMDLTSDTFKARVERFISDYGFVPNNRLLIYYAGHGHTLKSSGDGRELGYVVPVDAPNPTKDETGFRRKAISMDAVQGYAKEIQSKHAMFIFDSCFSGKLVSRNAIVIPPVILEDVAFPVRQFITAGAANQPVPDESIFRRSFVRGLEGEADRNGDGYITGTELADYLKEKVTNYSNRAQTPQYGKINDIELDKGDFIFTLSGNAASPATGNTSPPAETLREKDRAAVETEAWNYLKNSTNPQDFRDFLIDFPKGANAANAKIKLEQTAWDRVKDSGDKSRLQTYLNEFPAGTNAPLAKIRIRQIETPALNDLDNSVTPIAGTIVTNSIGMKFGYAPAGSFQMGSANGKNNAAIHTVIIGRGFYMGRTEVTQGQWSAVMGNNPSDFNKCGPNCPVEHVGWEDAHEFIRRLNARGEGTYRLPTESEWEYSCRAGSTSTFSFGENEALLDGYAWYSNNSGGKTHEAAMKQPNAWGLYDLHGNVMEWVEDWYGYYPNGTATDPAGVTTGTQRVFRGGGFGNAAEDQRSANRYGAVPLDTSDHLGFRVLRTK